PPPVERTAQTPEVVARAMAYIEKYPPITSHPGASRNCFALACRLVRGFRLDRETALRLMLHSGWNAGCLDEDGRPWPWTAHELRHKIEDARWAPENKEEGYLLNAPRKDAPPGHNGNGKAHAPAAGSNGQALGSPPPAAPENKPTGPQPQAKKFSDIQAKAIKWLMPKRIPLGKVTVFDGDP